MCYDLGRKTGTGHALITIKVMIAPLPFPESPATRTPTDTELLRQYQPLVRRVVGRMVATLPSSVEAADLYSVGLAGLVAAVRNYDPAQGRTFVAYAIQRIRGAVLDELRRLDTLPRTARMQSRRLRDATQKLAQELGREPTDEEIRQHLELDTSAFVRMRQRTQAVTLVSMDAPRAQTDSSESPDWHECLADPDCEATSDRLEHEETLAILRRRLDELSERPRRILELYYRDGRRLAEIARIFGVTEARICQIHAQTLASLRRSLPKAIEA